jgi:HD-like signal output (HDOD) protein
LERVAFHLRSSRRSAIPAANAAESLPARAQAPAAQRVPAPTSAETAPVAAKPFSKACVTEPSKWPRLLTREQTIELVDRIADCKTIAGVVSQIIAITNSPRADLTDLVKIIESDPILATRVLQLSNSPGFASARGRVTSIEGAARNIGLKGIQQMAMSVGIFGAFPPDESDGFNSMRCWQHSFAVAEIMALLGAGDNPAQEANQHLVGLCHDLGAILLRQHFTEQYETILEFATTNHLPLHAVESVALGIRHPDLVGRLLTHIGLPSAVVQPIREFYERESRGPSVNAGPVARKLAIANQLAHGLLLAASLQDNIAPITKTDWRELTGVEPAFSLDPVTKRNEIVATTNILARLPPKDEVRLVAPLVARTPLRIWLVRPQYFTEFDPVGMALSLATDLQVSQKFPEQSEWLDLDGLVLMGLRTGVAPLNAPEILRMCQANGQPELPVLALMVQGDEALETPHLRFARFPLSLDNLQQWLGSIAAAKKVLQPTC